MEAEIDTAEEKKWCSLARIERRVVGVLVEKSKTTPDVYPMTINAITTASNQKSNRKPLMQLDHDNVEDALNSLREKGAVVELQGDARKPKYKHQLYQWLGVGKVELAVMAELLLRGEQTLGDLRGRASRMEKIIDISELRPIVRELTAKDLVIALTPEGRGQVVTHNLYQPEELAKLERQMTENDTSAMLTQPSGVGITGAVSRNTQDSEEKDLWHLRNQIVELQATVARLQDRIEILERRS